MPSARGGKRDGAGRKTNAQKTLEQGFVCAFFSLELQNKSWKKLLNSKDENIKLRTAMYLTDRLYGKPVQRTELTGPDGDAIPVSIEVDL